MSGWIWSAEQLPEEGHHVLRCVRELCNYDDGEGGYLWDVPGCFMTEGVLYKRGEWGWWLSMSPDVWHTVDNTRVIAWQELPKPPRGWKHGEYVEKKMRMKKPGVIR